MAVFARDLAEDIACGIEAQRLMNHIVHLGVQIHQLLKALKLYEHGYLFHQFIQWWGKDIIVGDFRYLDLEPQEDD